MITKEEEKQIGFAQCEWPHSESYRLVIDDFVLWSKNGRITLDEWGRDEQIDISHLNAEQVKILISLLTKPKG